MSAADLYTDARFMRCALRLAMNGRGSVEPNPMVGCVIVKGGRVIGEGYHERYGGPHAEPNALAACAAAGESPRGATAYVTLEPCCHTDKKTPPCAPKLIEAKVGRVVVGCLDPNPDVNGKGLAMLREAGITVDGPLLEAEAKQLIAPFIARVRHQRPYVTLKWAQSADGKVAGAGGRRVQISNATSSRVVHELRARCDAILVGIRTVLNDDPLLTVRVTEPLRPLLRAVLDRDLEVPVTSKLVETAAVAPLIAYCSEAARKAKPGVVATLEGYGVTLASVPVRARQLVLEELIRDLATRGVTHLLVEPGPSLVLSFLASQLADRIWVFRSASKIDDEHAPSVVSVPYPAVGEIGLDGDRLTEYLNPESNSFFGLSPSADFVLAAEAHAGRG
jgi:diaminohydroxyphosphoribosylaminopyrimidine deaminase / 5-amino-6-(5-phosphoribosylamino)uracil reductase